MPNAPEKSSEIRTESDQRIWKLRGYRHRLRALIVGTCQSEWAQE